MTMKRVVAGAVAALLFTGAGIFWWQSRAQGDEVPLIASPPPAAPIDELPVGDSGLKGAPPPMPPSALPQTREQKRFARYDRNRDGIITRTEMLSTRTKAFQKLDTDGNNLLSFEEWAVKTSDRFGEADIEDDGRLTPAEFATTAPKKTAKARCDC